MPLTVHRRRITRSSSKINGLAILVVALVLLAVLVVVFTIGVVPYGQSNPRSNSLEAISLGTDSSTTPRPSLTGIYYDKNFSEQELKLSAYERTICVTAAKRLVEIGIELLAIDFDQTMVDIHTGGRWEGGSVSKLAAHVRQQFKCLLSETGAKIPAAIVTFSRQEELISEVMKIAVPEFSILVYGGDNRQSQHGKKKQIGRAVKDIPGDVRQQKIVLIDDNVGNIELAQEASIKAVVFNPDHPNGIFDSLRELD